jgi:DNA-directed RNA polymerase specialized sigma subunit
MLYHERFLSGSSPVVTEDGSVLPCYLEQFPSKDRADADDEMSDNRTTIRMIMGSADLTEFESQVVTLFYADNDKKEIAAELGQPQSWVNETLKSAICKMRVAAGQEPTCATKNG